MSFADFRRRSIFFRMIRRQINARNSAWHKVAFWTSLARCLRNLSTASRLSLARMIFARPVLAFSLSLNSLRAAAALNLPMHPSITLFTISLARNSRHVSLRWYCNVLIVWRCMFSRRTWPARFKRNAFLFRLALRRNTTPLKILWINSMAQTRFLAVRVATTRCVNDLQTACKQVTAATLSLHLFRSFRR